MKKILLAFILVICACFVAWYIYGTIKNIQIENECRQRGWDTGGIYLSLDGWCEKHEDGILIRCSLDVVRRHHPKQSKCDCPLE